MNQTFTELSQNAPYPADLNDRLKAGEIFVARGCLQRLGLMDDMLNTSLEGISRVAGAEVAAKLKSEGVEHIHRHTSIEQIAEITDMIYGLAKQKAGQWISKIAPEILNSRKPFYYESKPNIRFVAPYDYMAEGLEKLGDFGKKHGRGKITPHPPHRDSWVDCPDNVINVWIAVGPIPRGNGLTIFAEQFGTALDHVANGSIAYYENPGQPVNFDLDAGDAILFHGEHLHSTVLNRVDTTRHVISFRIMDRRPHYPNGHYHHYLYSSLAQSPLRLFSELPANLAWGWVSTRLGWVAEKLGLKAVKSLPKDWKKHGTAADGQTRFALDSIPVNGIKAITDSIAVARLEHDKVVAFHRRCPHDGADFAVGSVCEGKVVCPWHNLPFDTQSGTSPCSSLKKLRFYPTKIEQGTVTVVLDGVAR